jgi:Chromo (CHRromatin Organisation MOdifier) domain
MLEPTSPNTILNRIQPLPAPVIIDGEPEFEIADILDSKINKRRKACKLLYLILWTGYEGTDEETSWILASELDHASELVLDFHKSYPAKPGPLHSLKEILFTLVTPYIHTSLYSSLLAILSYFCQFLFLILSIKSSCTSL